MEKSKTKGYVDLWYKPLKTDLICEFYVEPKQGYSIKQVAEHVAGESSIGTWTDVVTMSDKIKNMGARVFSIDQNCIRIAYPMELFELGNMPQIMSSIAGNIFGMKSVENLRLEDVRWPRKLMESFKGPIYGINGVRKLLKVRQRPLVGTIIKPKLGLDEKKHARVAYEAWIGGCDIVKDDENLSSQRFNKFEKRVKETLKMRNKAEKETGERKMYMPNITAETNEMIRRAKFVKKQGGEYVMIDVITTGWSALQTFRKENEDLKLVVHAHRAGHAAFTRNQKHGISMLVIGDIVRLIGVDQLHIGTVVGKMAGGREEVVSTMEEIEERIVVPHGHRMAEDWHHIKPIFAVCSGGLHPGHVPRLMDILGKDIIIQMGGGIHGHPNGTMIGSIAARQAVDAAMKNISLKKYAKNNTELKRALEKWGE